MSESPRTAGDVTACEVRILYVPPDDPEPFTVISPIRRLNVAFRFFEMV